MFTKCYEYFKLQKTIYKTLGCGIIKVALNKKMHFLCAKYTNLSSIE